MLNFGVNGLIAAISVLFLEIGCILLISVFPAYDLVISILFVILSLYAVIKYGSIVISEIRDVYSNVKEN